MTSLMYCNYLMFYSHNSCWVLDVLGILEQLTYINIHVMYKSTQGW